MCHIVSYGLFPGVCSLNANVSGHSRLAYEDGTERVFRNVGY
jgi:hypothetical protein